MPQVHPARGNRKRKRRLASRRARERDNGARKRTVAPVEDATPSPPPVGRLERTRRLILAALRVWELKRKIRD